MQRPLRIATRKSPLALAQAELVKAALLAVHSELAEGDITLVPLSTKGDEILDRALIEAGGKGLFVKEIEQALIDGRADLAVHSAKDLPADQPAGLALVAFLPREDPRDVFLSPHGTTFEALPEGAVVGTASLRRQAQVLAERPDIKVISLRGNLGTRLAKLEAGEVDATFLALAGLRRLGKGDLAAGRVMPTDVMLPAPAQGAIAIQARADDDSVSSLVAALNHRDTEICVAAERAFLAALDGSCRTPLAALATLDGDRLRLTGKLWQADGSDCQAVEAPGVAGRAAEIGRDAGRELLEKAGSAFFDRLRAAMGEA